MKEIVQKQLYTVLRSQVLSKNGKFLFVASNFGDIATFFVDRICHAIEKISSEKISDPVSVYNCSEKIFSLAFHNEFLVVGSAGFVSGYSINSTGGIVKKVWSIQLPISQEACEMNEVNDLWVDSENDTIYAACGDANVYVCSIEDGSFITKLSGHSDYIHKISGQ